MAELKTHHVWDASIRWFHWINLLCLLGLIAVGTVILNAKVLGVPSDGKILLKTVHVWIGYLFALNLLWRLIWAFVGGRFARWGAILPLGKQYRQQLSNYVAKARQGKLPVHLGHNPLGKIMVTALLLLLSTQALTGLVLAGTDVYMPPFGAQIREWVADDQSQVQLVQPYSKENVNEEAYEQMRAFRKPFITVHYWNFWFLLAAIALHVAAVVVAEVRERQGLISAMFSGDKVLAQKPVDIDD